LPTPKGLEDLVEPLASPGSPIELTASPSTSPNTPSTIATSMTTMVTPLTVASISNNNASNHMHHDIDTDVEMEKMVSKVCE